MRAWRRGHSKSAPSRGSNYSSLRTNPVPSKDGSAGPAFRTRRCRRGLIMKDEAVFNRRGQRGVDAGSAGGLAKSRRHRAQLVVTHNRFVTTADCTDVVRGAELDPRGGSQPASRGAIHDEDVVANA